MTLTSALNTAKSALAATQTQTALVSRNIANASVEGATRKYANVVTGSGGRVEVRSIAQSSSSTLYRNMLESRSGLEQVTAVKDGLNRIDETIGDIENGNTPAALIGTLLDKLKSYAASPASIDFARAAANSAQDVVTALNQGTQTIDTIRRDADDNLVIAAKDMTNILARIEDLNRQVVSGTAGNRDVTDLVDDRDRAVAELAGYVGVTAQVRGDNDLVLYTDSGVTLFDKVARSVSFTTTQPLVDGQPGNGFRIDGTLVTGANAVMPIKSGKVAGLVQLRDDVTVKYQTQLDEIARGLVAATAERGATGADVAGLFTAVDPTTLATTSTLGAGTFTAGSLVVGDKLSFTLTLGQTKYNVSGTLTGPNPIDAAKFASNLNTMIAAATPVGGGAALGTGHVDVTAPGGVLTLTAGGVGGKLPLAISDVVGTASGSTTADPTKTGGLGNVAATIGNAPVYGLARQLRLAAAVTADPTTIRDGVAVDVNPTNLGGYDVRLKNLRDALNGGQNFATAANALGNGSVVDFASSSVSWLQDNRSKALDNVDYKQTLLDKTKETLSNETGVNLDQETLRMLDLERSYQASAKILTTVDEMLKTLLNAI